jgi:hypothetical protein
MSFFNTLQIQPQQSQQAFQQPAYAMASAQQPTNMLAGLNFGGPSTSAGSGSNTPMSGFGTGISLPMTPASGQNTSTQPAPAPKAKSDPFADLANW